MRSSFTVVLILFTSLGSPCLAAESITIRGTIEDQTSSVVPNAAVELSLSGARPRWFTTTDNAGAFRFENLSSGSYVMTIRHDGFETKTIHLDVGATSPELVRIVLLVSELHQEITVNTTAAQLDVEDAENQDKVELTDHILQDLPSFNQDYLAAVSSFLDPRSVETGGCQLSSTAWKPPSTLFSVELADP